VGVPRGRGFGGPAAARAALGTLDGTNEGEARITLARPPRACQRESGTRRQGTLADEPMMTAAIASMPRAIVALLRPWRTARYKSQNASYP
jgi:hypothetical protein